MEILRCWVKTSFNLGFVYKRLLCSFENRIINLDVFKII